jgi:pimeloyl-ACP methyl ester carboxylesterase
MPTDLVVLVPGFMGSALLYKGPGRSGELAIDYIWSEDLTDILFGDAIDRLQYPAPTGVQVEPKHILNKLVLHNVPLAGTEVYATLRRHLAQLADCREGRMLKEFSYDWRESIEVSAERLVRWIVQVLSENRIKSIGLVSHSMGGLICKLAIASSDVLQKYGRLLVYIGAPMLGSTKAYFTLQRFPALNSAFSTLTVFLIYKLREFVDGKAKDRLMQAIRTFPSVYELLPPQWDSPHLLTETGQGKSCVDDELWSEPYRPLVMNARRVQEKLASIQLDIPTWSIFSSAQPTDQIYQLRGNPPYVFNGEVVKTDTRGDGTVTAYSATYGCPHEMRFLVTTGPNKHLDLCRNKDVLTQLEGLVFG